MNEKEDDQSNTPFNPCLAVDPLPTFNDLIKDNTTADNKPITEPVVTEVKQPKAKKTEVFTEDEKERIIIEEIVAFLSEVNSLKEQGNALFKEQNYAQAEETYSKGIERIHTFTPSQTITREVPQLIGLLRQMQELLISLLGNLAAAFSKELRYKEAIAKVLNVNSLFDHSY